MGLLSKAEKIQERQGDEIYGRSPLTGLLSHTLLNMELERINRELSKTFKETENRIHEAIMSPPDRFSGLAIKSLKPRIDYAMFDQAFPVTEVWKVAMKQAGCKFVKYIKKVQREIKEDDPDDIYEIIAVFLEKEYPVGTLCSKAEVDVALLMRHPRPEVLLCEELAIHVEVMDTEAKKTIEEGI